jgi:hypothetical protein
MRLGRDGAERLSALELALILLKSRTDAGGVDGTLSRIEEIP